MAFRLVNGHARLDLSGHHDECLLDVLAVLGGGLEESDVVVFGQLFSLVGGHLAGIFHIALVANEDARYIVLGVLLDFAHPGLNVAEGLSVGDVVGDDDAVGALVVAASDGLEPLLAGGVPLTVRVMYDLELDGLAVNFNSPDFLGSFISYEVDSDGGHKVVSENIILFR